MAWLLIRARSNPKPTAYKAGDIVEVRPDNCPWGRLEGLPAIYRIQVTGLDADRVKHFLEQVDESPNLIDPERLPIFNRVRKFRVHVASVPAAIRTALQTTGTVTVTLAQIRNYIRDNADQTAVLP